MNAKEKNKLKTDENIDTRLLIESVLEHGTGSFYNMKSIFVFTDLILTHLLLCTHGTCLYLEISLRYFRGECLMNVYVPLDLNVCGPYNPCPP